MCRPKKKPPFLSLFETEDRLPHRTLYTGSVTEPFPVSIVPDMAVSDSKE
jgi:hypothetical protein